MATTNLDALELDTTLTVDGASTLTGAVTATGGVTGDVTGDVTGTLTGAVVATTITASSTLAVTGASTLTGETNVTGVFGKGTAAQLGGPDDVATSYDWLYCDGTDVKVAGIMMYDTTTADWRRVYLDNGTLTAV